MSRSSTTWKDSLRLLLLVIVSPIILLLAGPILALAAIKGRLSLDGLILNPGKHHRKNREIAFVMGIVLWVFTWGVIGWIGFAIYFNRVPAGGVTVIAIELTPVSSPTKTETPMPTPSPTFASTQTSSPTAVPFATYTPSQNIATQTPSSSPIPTDTPTAIPATKIPTVFPTPNSAAEISTQAAAIQSVSAANRALRQAIDSPSTQNLNDLSNFWQGEALTRVRLFALEMHAKYRAPVQADYRLEGAYRVSDFDSKGNMVITSQERWQYKGAGDAQTALTVYTYTVYWDGSAWKIVDYDFSVGE